jgi:hypothetical protein
MKGMIGERNVTLPNCGLTDFLVWSWVCLSCDFGVVAQPLRRAETLVIFWFLCGPFAARGATGEAEYPSRLAGRYR